MDTGHFKTPDGVDHLYRAWIPEGEVSKVLCIVHGMGEHSGRYDEHAKRLNDQGIAVFAFDHRGHGESAGKRGHTPSIDALLDGVDAIVAIAREAYPDKPLFIWGQSVGGNIAVNYVLRRTPDITGLITTAIFIKLAFEPPKLQVALAKFINQFWPKFTLGTDLDADALAADENVIQKYNLDPFVHRKITSNMFLEIMSAAEYAIEHAKELHVPMLMMHGAADRLVSVEGSREFRQRTNDACVYHEYDEGYHELHNDVMKDRVFQTMIDWMNAKAANLAPT